MNPMLHAALSSILRHFLTIAAGYLVAKGIWTSGEAESYVAGAIVALLTIGWALWDKYRSRLKLVTAMAMPSGVTEEQVSTASKLESAPPTTLKRDEAPRTMPRSAGDGA